MGRKSRLTPEQWAEIDRRLINGERPAPLAREFCVTEWLLAGRKRDLRNADTGQMELRQLMRAVGNAKDDEAYVTAILKVWEWSGEIAKVFQTGSVRKMVYEFEVGPCRIDALIFHEDGGATLIEAKGAGSLRHLCAGIGQAALYGEILMDTLPPDQRPKYLRKWLIAPIASLECSGILLRACRSAGMNLLPIERFTSFADFRQRLALGA